MTILSKNNQKIKDIIKLKDKKYRDKSKLFLVEGYHLVNEAKEKGILVETLELIDKNKFDNSIQVSPEILASLTDTKTPQGIVGVCKISENNSDIGSKVLVLDNLQDPGNVGTIIRTAKAFGFNDIIISNFDYFNPKVIRSSQGAFFKTNLYKTNNTRHELINLKSQGYTIYSTILNTNAKQLNSVVVDDKKLVIVVGNEGNGISKEVQEVSDFGLYIPIEFESLNVAVATGIVLNHFYNDKKR
ncbi:TrmH family RNA methyltransferase [Mycoplasma nasistruthionis]|uniref:RNA methyltransferase n=1 Tax=Mycoplasma nasistruthionis TaxID=353852 RepID=A0A5B7XVC7_9MOLU|nr:RNA methyltransferase [Mycoplasma nasistruthionis]QCZ36931.1 RNA methyltransferase [Mycoplasma nasistruthionis]